MSRICGVICPNLKKDAIRPILHKMIVLMQYESWHRIDEWCDDGIGLGHTSIGAVNEEVQPIDSQNSAKLVISAGKIVAYEDRKRELIDKDYRFRYLNNDAEFVIHLYEEYGIDKFKELNGIFAFSIWDKAKKELIVVNDRYGLRTLYYYFDENQKMLLFASELKSISRQDFIKKEINWDAWNVFLRLGYLVEEDTFFKNIHFFPQASVLHFDLNKISFNDYWNYDSLKMKDSFDEREDIDKLVYLFRQSMKRRIISDKQIGVFLSGGLDSRGIVAELKHQNIPFNSYTTRKFSSYDSDKKIAALVAEKLKIKNEFIDLPNNFLETREPYKNKILDYQSDEHAWLLPMLDRIPSDVKINYGGLCQDVIFAYLFLEKNLYYFNMLKSKEYKKFINDWIYKKFSFLKLPFKINKYNMAFFSEKMKDRFSDEIFFEKVKNQFLKFEKYDEPYLQYVLYTLSTRTRRENSLASFGLILNRVETLCPYLDNNYFEFGMSIPMHAKLGGTLRKKFLDRAYPELAGIIENDGYIDYYDNEYVQRMEYLFKIEIDLLKKMKSAYFNFNYLLPRLIFDLIYIKYALFFRKNEIKSMFSKCHYWLIGPLHFLSSWISSEGLSESIVD